MIACLSPLDRDLDENISTLNYASLTGQIKNEPTIVVTKSRLDSDFETIKAKLQPSIEQQSINTQFKNKTRSLAINKIMDDIQKSLLN